MRDHVHIGICAPLGYVTSSVGEDLKIEYRDSGYVEIHGAADKNHGEAFLG